MMNIQRVLQTRYSKLFTIHVLKCGCSTSTNMEEKIEIPKRIPRGPTDVLRALESTVGRDPTASHYKYHDDPYLIPLSNMGKRTFAMSQEAGRKAAHFIRREHADLFQHKEADPPIDAFFPPMIFNENSDVAETDLHKLIENAQVSDAKLVYKLLNSKGIKISPDTEQNLLEMLCFQNCEDSLSEDFIEERWFRQSSKSKEKQIKTWKDGDFAEEVFISMENPSAKAYSAIIQGMAKYFQVERAWQLFEEAQQKGLTLNTNTYNALISVTNFLKENFDMRWSLVTDLLTQMKQNNLKPNLGTLNSVLQALSFMKGARTSKENALKTLSEFKNTGIEPSLASWYYVLQIFCRERGPVSTILYDIMDEIENKDHQIRDLRDTHFFVTAMEVCRHHLKDVDMAKRVYNLLHYGNNYDLIGDSYKESVYYRHYFALLCGNLPFDEFMKETYERLVPHIYVPEPGIMEEVLKQVDLNGSIEYIPKLWSDMIIFEHTFRENLVELILGISVNNKPLPEMQLEEQLSKVGWDIYSRTENQHEHKSNKFILTGDMLGKIMILLLRNKDFEKACEIMDKLDMNQSSVVGVPKIEALELFVEQCIEQKAPSRAISCIQYCSDCGFPEAKSLAINLHKGLNLDENYLERLSKIVGDLELAKE